jgi:hypothetical protein
VQVGQWLVANGLYRDILAAVVGTIIGFVLGRLLAWRPVRKVLAEHKRSQARIADLLDTKTPGGLADLARELDTSTPGGLTDVLDALRRLLDPPGPEGGEDAPAVDLGGGDDGGGGRHQHKNAGGVPRGGAHLTAGRDPGSGAGHVKP